MNTDVPDGDISFFDSNPTNPSPTNTNGASGPGGSNVNVQAGSNGNIQDDSILNSSLYYNMSGNKVMVIFNHHTYKKTRHFNHQPSTRSGTHHDVQALKNVFKNFGFKITTCTDYTHSQIINVLEQLALEDHSRTSCFVVVILTHGDRGGYVCAADKAYPLKDLFRILEAGDKGLVNKPKLFFVQACRGNETDNGRIVQTDGQVESSILVPSHIDFLVMQSSVEDYISWREDDGSWMIQELCEVLKTNYQNMDLLQMITLTNQEVAYNRVSSTRNIETHNKKQTLETRFTLTKLVKF